MLNLEPETHSALPADLVQRISDARQSGELTDCELEVLRLLVDMSSGPRAGKHHAIQISQMQAIWAVADEHIYTDRQIKASVKELIETHGVPVCSSRDRIAGGYYLAVTGQDLEAAERPLRGEIISLAKRLKAFNPKSQFARNLAGQLSVENQ